VAITVESTRTEVRRALLNLVDVMVDAGAYVNPHLRFVETEGQISVWCHGDDPWLMRIPKDTLVPVADIAWSDEPPLVLLDAPGLTPLQRDVLDACVTEMREVGTWEYFRDNHPRATISDPEVVAVIQSLHPAFTPSTSAAAMLKSRTIGVTLSGDTAQSHLMPLLDLVNHHPNAPAYTWDEEFLCIPTWRSGPTTECFVSYGSRRDALGIALAYGYVDENITRVNALSGDYSLGDGSILHLRRGSHHRVSSDRHSLIIEGAALDAVNPYVKRTTFDAPVENFLKVRGVPALQARHLVRVVWRRIRESEADRFEATRALVIARSEGEVVVRALNRQMRILTP
jgi:hypothetical protein